MGEVTVGDASWPRMQGTQPSEGKRPTELFIEKTPQYAAGNRVLPPMSVPTSITEPWYATRAAPPPVDAPGENARL